MCDIYDAKCKECDAEIDMHLGDYNTDRDEVEVFCDKHIPQQVTDGVLWEYEGKKVFVRVLTANAKANWEGNHPNACNPKVVSEFGKIVKM